MSLFGKTTPDSTPLYMQAMLQAQQMAAQQTEAAKQDDIAQQQLALSREAYQSNLDLQRPVNEQLIASMKQQADAAAADRARYEGTFVPLEDQYIAKAQAWDTPAAETQAAGAAEANVAQQAEQARQAAARGLQAYGIDPGSPRYAALDIGARTNAAAAEAGAGNTAINQRQMEGMQFAQNAIAMGQKLPQQALAGFAGSGSAGSGAVSNANATSGTGFSTMGTPGSYFNTGAQYSGLANQSAQGIGSTFNNIYQGQVAQNDAAISGLYGLAGATVGGVSNYLRPRIPGFAGGGEVRGAIPDSASPSQGIAVDDVPARLSPGEFVVPKDVVQWKGEEHFQKLIDQSREKKQEATAQPDVRALPVPPAYAPMRAPAYAPMRRVG